MTDRGRSPNENRLTPLAVVHRGLTWLLLFGLAGLEVELLLLKHTDGAWQILPLVLLGTGPVIIGWYLRWGSAGSIRSLKGLMWLYIVSGLVGTLLHFKGNVAYEKESNPGLSRRELYAGAVQGSTPTLAPGAMLQLGLLGLILAYSGGRKRDADSVEESIDIFQSTE